MPKPTSKSRQELRSRFVRNAIPTETDFADLIAASLNQADDGVLKLPDQPLGLVRQKPDQPVLRFFADPAAEGSVWQLQLGAGDKPGFGLAAADGKLALFVDGATGNVGIGTAIPAAKLDVQGDLKVSGCFTPSTGKIESSGILFPKDPGGGSGDAAWLRYYPNSGESCLLEIGIANDIDDHIALMPSGNVGIGTTTPGCKLDVNGDAYISGCLGIRAGSEIFFSGYGQIRSLDDSHRILFRKEENKMELREKGDIIFSSGSTEGQETSKMVIHGSGNVGIGTISPVAKLQVTGNVSITSAEGQNYACKNNFMAAGSLTIGGIDRNYGGGTKWNNSTAGLLLETLENTEIAVHDDSIRLASFMYYEGANNSFTIGRDMGWGAISTVNVQGSLKVNGKVDSQNARIQAIANNSIRTESNSWTDMPAMTVTADIDGPALVLFKTGGMQGAPGAMVRARFRLLIDNIEKAFTLHEFHNAGWELRDASLMWLESSLAAGNHVFKVQWNAEGGTVGACWYNDLRSLIVIKL
jgi:hypothetical protein